MTCFFSNCDYAETYGDAELSLALMGTGATRTLYMLTAREAATRRLLFDMRIEAGADDLMVRARRANRSTDNELRDVAISYARYLIDDGAWRSVARYRLEVREKDETLEPVGRTPKTALVHQGFN